MQLLAYVFSPFSDLFRPRRFHFNFNGLAGVCSHPITIVIEGPLCGGPLYYDSGSEAPKAFPGGAAS